MELETAVLVYNEKLGAKPVRGKLIRISEEGYYEVALEVNQRVYQALLPVGNTVLVAADPIPEVEAIPFERY